MHADPNSLNPRSNANGVACGDLVRQVPYPPQVASDRREFWWYRQNPDCSWIVAMISWPKGIVDYAGRWAAMPLAECPGEWVGPIPLPNDKGEATAPKKPD